MHISIPNDAEFTISSDSLGRISVTANFQSLNSEANLKILGSSANPLNVVFDSKMSEKSEQKNGLVPQSEVDALIAEAEQKGYADAMRTHNNHDAATARAESYATDYSTDAVAEEILNKLGQVKLQVETLLSLPIANRLYEEAQVRYRPVQAALNRVLEYIEDVEAETRGE